MQAGNECHQAKALAQEYVDKLLHDTAPASYLPMLACVVQTPALPLPFKVCSHWRLAYISHWWVALIGT